MFEVHKLSKKLKLGNKFNDYKEVITIIVDILIWQFLFYWQNNEHSFISFLQTVQTLQTSNID
jgi:hypothetical protein